MAKIWHLRDFFNFYLILDYYNIRTKTNFENLNGRSLDLHVIMLFMLKRIVLILNRFYRGHFQNTPNIKTFFGYAEQMGMFSNNTCFSEGVIAFISDDRRFFSWLQPLVDAYEPMIICIPD